MPPLLAGVAPARRGWEWHHLRLRGEGAGVRQWPGHGGVVDLGFHADSVFLACLDAQGGVRLWDAREGREVRRLRLRG